MRIEHLDNLREIKILENPPSLVITAETVVAIKLTKDMHANPEFTIERSPGEHRKLPALVLVGEGGNVEIVLPTTQERVDDIANRINKLLGW